jgi:hypothetical protein
LYYIIHKILIPNGYTLNGEVMWQGEETGDVGKIFVEDNVIFTEPYGGIKEEFEGIEVYRYPAGNVTLDIQKDVVYIDSPSETLPDDSASEEDSEEDVEKKILQAKVDALTEAMKNVMNPTLVDKILKEVEEKAKA